MLNKEKYKKEILDIVCYNGGSVTIINNLSCSCAYADCSECDFKNDEDCNESFVKWANSEYKKKKEKEIDWSKVPIDTPIYVSDGVEPKNWVNRYFAEYEDGIVYAWEYGTTSWSQDTGSCPCPWRFAKIREDIDCSQWYKEEVK